MAVPEHHAPPVPPAAAPATSSRPGAGGVAACAAPEAVPQVWDACRDPAFFALTARLVPPAVTLALTVLLASYDDGASSLSQS